MTAEEVTWPRRPTISAAFARRPVDAGVAAAKAAAIESGGAAVASFGTRPGLALIAGGRPVIAGGQVAGGIGVAGAMTAAQDRRDRRGRRRASPVTAR